MEQAATKIQRFYREKSTKKKEKEKKEEGKPVEVKKEEPSEEKYDRANEKNQEIGEEFLNPDKDMEEAATKIQRFYRDKSTKKKEKQTKEVKKEGKEVKEVKEVK